MIDAHAVSAQLEMLGDLPSTAQGEGHAAAATWVTEALQDLPLEHKRDAAGNTWVTLTGASARAVLLGSYFETSEGESALDSHLSLVVGLETIKALAHRYGQQAPCTVQLALWALPKHAAARQSGPGAYLPFPQDVAAYLELHVGPGGPAGGSTEPALGVGTSAEGESASFHPRLSALCDEAVRELTGTSANLPLPLSAVAAEVARAGIPTAAMYVQAAAGAQAKDLPGEQRLHLLQAAEAFGRWAEATMHLVGGDPVDMWAREHRVPRS